MTRSASSALGMFEPVVATWFRERFGEPTEIQRLTWPKIAANEHVLVSAPTGSGKTLAAFLWSLSQLLGGSWQGGVTRVLYVSPLRALNNDIQRNLLAPLAELERALEATGSPAQSVRVATRSADTPPTERQKMVRNPPEILITTPESLNILLTSQGGRSTLGGIRCVILDEIHAVAGSKRGTHLITAVERLTLLAGEFQRIALSATVSPVARVARFIGGYIRSGAQGGDATYLPRPVAVLSSRTAKRYSLRIEAKLGCDEAAREALATDAPSVWDPLIHDLRSRIRGHRSTLVFANSRRLAEKITRLINETGGEDLAYSHHGSLSREIRAVVEERMKAGRLPAIVATNSLELGIDIGSLDEVVLIQTPPSIGAAIQRLGRSGHGVGEVSQGVFYPLYDRDLIESLVVLRGVEAQDLEELHPVSMPLDVLAQIIVSMLVAEPWSIDDLWEFVRCAWPYRHLSRRQFDLVLEMLTGRYAGSRLRELDPKITVDHIDGRLRARRGTARLVYSSGGTIPDRGYYHLRLQDGRAKLGELDEEFVWERSVGDTFALGAQSWQITAITHNDVLVRPSGRGSAMAPFWRAEERDRDFHLSERIGRFLEDTQRFLVGGNSEDLTEQLQTRYNLSNEAASRIVALLVDQIATSGVALPHRHHVLVERVARAEEGDDRQQVIVHTGWGGRVNRPLALALAGAWSEETGESLQIEQDNDSVMILLPQEVDVVKLLHGVRPDNLERLLRGQLERSGFFGARFRENAGRALLLPRASFQRRVPLWFNRQRAKRLLSTVATTEDFPILAETWRACLQDEFDLKSLVQVLSELEAGDIQISEIWGTSPTPFAADIVWKRTNRLMYEDDEPEIGERSRMRMDLLRELVHGSGLRPKLPSDLIAEFTARLQRIHAGYSPQTSEELIDWVQERVAIPLDEWRELLATMQRDLQGDELALPDVLREVHSRLVRWDPTGSGEARAVVHLEQAMRLQRGLAGEGLDPCTLPLDPSRSESEQNSRGQFEATDEVLLEDLVSDWMRFYGPISMERIAWTFGLAENRMQELVETLVEQERLVVDRFRDGDADGEVVEVCDAENLERLLRRLRVRLRAVFEARPLHELPLFLSHRQGLAAPGDNPAALRGSLERLFGYPAPAGLWETEIFPARLDSYRPEWLDALFAETDLGWQGCGSQRVAFCLEQDRELLGAAVGEADTEQLRQVFPELSGRFRLEDLAAYSGSPSRELVARLWELSWKGWVSNSTYQVVRQGVLSRFAPPPSLDEATSAGTWQGRRLSRRGRFDRWTSRRPTAGEWFVLSGRSPDLDALDLEEMNKDRVRLLLVRYGIVFRELLARELPALGWGPLFRALRLMELSGEVVAGHFFSGIPGLQFMLPEAFRALEKGMASDVVYWMSAADPASPCGLGLDFGEAELPARRPFSHLVYHGSRVVVISQRNAKSLEIRVGADHPRLPEYLRFLGILLARPVSPRRALTVRSINGRRADESPYVPGLAEMFSVTREPGALKLRRNY